MKKCIRKWITLLLVCAVTVLPSVSALAAEPEVLEDQTGIQSGGQLEGSDASKDMQPDGGDVSDEEQLGGSDASRETPLGDMDAGDEAKPQEDEAGKMEPGNSDGSGEALDASGQAGEVTEPITKEDKPYLALGANLTAEQQAVVLGLLGINPAELGDYDVIYITNEEEHQYLGNYVDASKIGTRSLSSVLIVKREKGHGINITTKNISYCTIGMYKNALITAGITDADIIVAAPTPISGTAALVGAMKAYSDMTGEEVTEESMDTALNELVLTGDLAKAVGDSEKAEELVAYLKQEVLSKDLTDEGEIREVIDKACEEFDIVLSEEEISQLIDLLKKIGQLDLDWDSIKNQAEELYNKLSKIDAGGFFEKVVGFFQSILDFFKGLFS